MLNSTKENRSIHFLQIVQKYRSRSNIQNINFEAVSEEGLQVLQLCKELEQGCLDRLPRRFFKPKCAQESASVREEGNKLFQKKAFNEALEKFNQSVLLAPSIKCCKMEEEPVFAYALANRSAVFFYTKQFDLCMQDIEDSLQNGYPYHLRYKLYERKAKCLVALGDVDEAVKTLHQSLDHLEKCSLDEKSKKKWKTSVNERLKTLRTCTPGKPSPRIENRSRSNSTKLPIITANRSSKFICTSEAFDITYTQDRGRDVVAGANVHVGDILGVEKPYSAVPDHGTHSVCNHCIQLTIANVPCRNCSSIWYCSSECETEAWDEYHKTECSFVSWLRNSPSELPSSNLGKITQLALRISLKAGYENLRNHFNQTTDVENSLEAGFTKGMYLNDYNSVFHMATNKESRPIGVRKDYAISAAVVVQLLDSLGLFQKVAEREMDKLHKENDKQNGDETSTGVTLNIKKEIKFIFAASLVHHMQLIQCNAYGIVEGDSLASGFRMKEAVYGGLGLYPTMGLVNHSCDPVLDISFQGSSAIYRACSNVKTGGQITVDYGPIYYLQERSERQDHLWENYYFHCQCNPCQLHWPLLADIETKMPKLKCPLCDANFNEKISVSDNVQCKVCGQSVDLVKFLLNLGKSHKEYAIAMGKAKEGNVKESLPVLKRHLTLMQEVIAPPWREFITCQSAIDQCYRMDANFYS